MTQSTLKFFVTSQIWTETNYGQKKHCSRNNIEPNELYDKSGHRIIIRVWHHLHSFEWMANDQIRNFFFRTVSKKEFSCHEWRLSFNIVFSGHEWFAVSLSFNNIFCWLVMDIHVGHHKVILLSFVYEEGFYGQATAKKKKKEHVNLEMFANARLVNELWL